MVDKAPVEADFSFKSTRAEAATLVLLQVTTKELPMSKVSTLVGDVK
jgi:hypothetical protein